MTVRHFLVIGAQRCGTTYLHRLLAAHPQIAMAEPARPEPKVLLSDDQVARGLGWYHETFFGHATSDQLLGEKSTSYLEHPEAAVRAAVLLGDPLIVVQVRDPVVRAVSNWRFSTDHGLEDRPLEAVLAANLEGPLPWDPERTSVSPYAYLERGRYTDYLPAWLDRFDVWIQVLEELGTSPDRIGDLYAHLGVDAAVRPEALGTAVNASSAPVEPIGSSLTAQLRDYYRDSDHDLARLLGRRPPWLEETP